MWPWLIMPLAALTLFFALRTVRDLPVNSSAGVSSGVSASDSDSDDSVRTTGSSDSASSTP